MKITIWALRLLGGVICLLIVVPILIMVGVVGYPSGAIPLLVGIAVFMLIGGIWIVISKIMPHLFEHKR